MPRALFASDDSRLPPLARKALIEASGDSDSDKDTETEVFVGEDDEGDDGRIGLILVLTPC